jgi:lipoic acid synthetase
MPEVATKTGMMLGLGETREEVLQAMEEIAAQGTHILTLGQYLQPTAEHLPIERYVHPDEFAEYKRLGEAMGFKHVEAGPLVRSSYHAFEQEEAARV